MTESVFRLRGAAVKVVDPAGVVNEWLAEMTRPSFEVGGGDAPVTVAVGPETREAAPSGPRVPCFALDTEVIRLVAERRATTMVIEDDTVGARYSVCGSTVHIEPIGANSRLRTAVFRVVRELLVAQLTGRSLLQLHSSGLAIGDRVVVLCGPKQAGKTTTMVHLAACGAGAIVANDRMLLTDDGGGWAAEGIPTIVSVRKGTVDLMPGRFRGLGHGERPYLLTEEEAHAWPSATAASRLADDESRALALSLAQVADLAGAPLHKGGRVSCAAFVRVDDAVDEFGIRDLSAADAERRVSQALFGIATRPREATIFESLIGRHVDGSDGEAVSRLAQGVRCVDLTVGRGLLASAEAGRRLADELRR